LPDPRRWPQSNRWRRNLYRRSQRLPRRMPRSPPPALSKKQSEPSSAGDDECGSYAIVSLRRHPGLHFHVELETLFSISSNVSRILRTAWRSTHSYEDEGAPGMLPKLTGELLSDGSHLAENAVRWTCVHPLASMSC